MKTFKCLTTFDRVSGTGSITSPKTGRILRLKRSAMKHLTQELRDALLSAEPVSIKQFTIQDLRDFLAASEASRDEYKDSLNGDYELPECIASEETDGECPHCEARMFRRHWS